MTQEQMVKLAFDGLDDALIETELQDDGSLMVECSNDEGEVVGRFGVVIVKL
jgi:hypothetical protein